MPLKETLQQLKTSSRSKLRAEVADIMENAADQLASSGIAERALQAGLPAPDFALTDWQGQRYDSREILARGPLILSFYRGSW